MPSEREISDLVRDVALVVSELADRIGALRSRLEVQQQLLFDSVEGQNQEIAALAEYLNGMSVSIEQANDDAKISAASLEEVRETLELIAPAEEDAVQPLQPEIEAIANHMQQTIDDAKETVEAFLKTQREALDAAVLQAGTDLKEALSEELVEKVEQALEELQEIVSDHVESVLQPVAAEIGGAVGRLIDNLVDDLARGDADTRRENAALQTAVQALQPAVDNLMEQFQRVTGLAHTVGL